MAELNLTKKLKNQLGKIFNVDESNFDIENILRIM